MAHGQNDHFSPIDEPNVGKRFAFVHREIIGLIQFSCNCAFLDMEKLCNKLVVFGNFSALNKCSMRIEWKWSIFSPVGTR